MTSQTATAARSRSWVIALLVVALLAGLPVVVWLELQSLAERSLRTQASDLNSLISGVRAYYAANVVGRILAAHGANIQVVHNYEDIPGAVPIPATLSLELGGVIGAQQKNIQYRFISDFPFKGRAPHAMDAFERGALAALRRDPRQQITEVTASALNDRVRIVAPIMMGAACVSCHNASPDSPKRDWKVGDVRGIQEVTIDQPIAGNILNEYFTEMSAIALTHGGTVDKFIGDAMLIFFGDPETKGAKEDAQACLRMALEMQRRLAELNDKWRAAGVEEPFRIRMGINSGYCNVGNFGSADRMDYTIIGAEANLAARLQSIAEPGQIVMSYETYALARELVDVRKLAPISMKGIPREVVPYAVAGELDAAGQPAQTFSAHIAGLDFDLDPSRIDADKAEPIRALLRAATTALERRRSPAG